MQYIIYIIIGIIAGIFAGMFGIGGGVVLIPALVFLLGLTQHQAQGTTLAIMVPPIGLLAAWRYWQSGNVKLSVAGFVCIGFFLGGYLGASLINNVPDALLKKLFGFFLLFVSIRMIMTK